MVFAFEITVNKTSRPAAAAAGLFTVVVPESILISKR